MEQNKNYQAIVQETIQEAKNHFNTTDFDNIFGATCEILKVENNYIYVVVEGALDKFRLEKFYISKLNEILESKCGTKINFKGVTKEEAEKIKTELAHKLTEVDAKPKKNNVYFRHEYTFENFMVGETNRFAFVSALKVADSSSPIFNPLYIFGDVGLGKTHLMTAIGQYVLDKNINTNIVYVSTNLFIEEYFLATSTKAGKENITSFYNKYREADILLVDDIQFLNNKTATQEEFFKIFEYLHSNNKQIILTSDRPASDLENMMGRLKSRFEWGLSVDIKTPDKPLKMSILKSKLSFLIRNTSDVSDEVLELIADYFPNNVRELEGGLRRFINYCITLDIPFTKENCVAALEGILPKNRKNAVKGNNESKILSAVKEEVCKYFKNITIDDLESGSRKQTITYPRQLAMYILKNTFNIPLSQIAIAFKRDHATVGHGIDKIDAEIKSNTMIKNDIDVLNKVVLPLKK